MHKTAAVMLLLLIIFPLFLAAQEEIEDENDGWDYYYDDNFTPGDQTFIITLGTVFPLGFRGNGSKMTNNITPRIGGTGSLSYNYYLTSNIFVGAEISGMFLPTITKNTLYIIPIGVRGGYQFNVWRLEIPVNLTFGMVWHRYLNSTYYGIYFKGGVSAFYMATYYWSFGINTNWYFFPQWTGKKETNAFGNFLDITLSARYHF